MPPLILGAFIRLGTGTFDDYRSYCCQMAAISADSTVPLPGETACRLKAHISL
jgi:hypothetical protein